MFGFEVFERTHTRRGSVSTAGSVTGEGSSSDTHGYATNKVGNFVVSSLSPVK